MNNIEEIILAIDNKDDDEAVITNCGNYYDTVKMETMQYSYDTHRYAIGVLVRDENNNTGGATTPPVTKQ